MEKWAIQECEKEHLNDQTNILASKKCKYKHKNVVEIL
jgi:hypothetical protein